MYAAASAASNISLLIDLGNQIDQLQKEIDLLDQILDPAPAPQPNPDVGICPDKKTSTPKDPNEAKLEQLKRLQKSFADAAKSAFGGTIISIACGAAAVLVP